MKTVGIIGGFGPEATAKFYLNLVKRCRETFATQPNLIIRNVNVPTKLEHELLVSGRSLNQFFPLLKKAATDLKNSGADFIVLPCNTLHTVLGDVAHSVGIPFISIVDESIRSLSEANIKEVGLIGSRITINSQLFQKATKDIQFVTIQDNAQRELDRSLFQFIATHDSRNLKKLLAKTIRSIGLGDVLVACTDFHGLCPNNIKIHDTLDILVQATINMI